MRRSLAFVALFALACGGSSSSSTPPPALAAPAALTATAGVRSAQLQWTASAGATAYTVYQSLDGAALAPSTAAAVSGTSAAVTGLQDGGSYQFAVQAVGPNGSSLLSAPSAAIFLPAIPSAPAISALGPVTAGSGGHFASVQAQPGVTYAWTISNGAITAGPATEGDTNSLEYTAGASGPVTLTCVASTAAGASTPGTASISVIAAPATPSISAAPAASAGQTGLVASVAAHEGMTYAWSISGGTITSDGGAAGVTASGANAITFTAGDSDAVSLGCVELNAAGAASAEGLATVSILGAPGTPQIALASLVTAGTSNVATVPARAGMTYAWTFTNALVDGDGHGATGGGVNTISFVAGAPGQLTATCVESNAAGESGAPASAASTVLAAPQEPAITAPAFAAPGSTGNLASVAARAGMSYAWTIQGGSLEGSASGVTSGGTNSISFTAGASGPVTLQCKELNAAGTSSAPGSATVQTAASGTHYALSAAPQVGTADNAGGVLLTATLTDDSGAPLAGQPVTLEASGSGNTFFRPSGVTGDDGSYATQLVSSVSEVKSIDVAGSSGTALLVPFVPPLDPLSQPNEMNTQSGNFAPFGATYADGVQTTTVSVQIFDSMSSPVTSYPVAFQVSGSGNVLSNDSAISDGSGTVSLTLASSVPEWKNVNVIIGTFVFTTQVLFSLPSQGINFNLGGGTASSSPSVGISIMVADDSGNQLGGVPLSFSSDGSGNFWSPDPPQVITDSTGSAFVNFGSTKAENKNITVTVGSGANSFQVVNTVQISPAGLSAQTSSLSADLTSVPADGSSSIALTARALDPFGNPVPSVFFSTGGSEDFVYPAFGLSTDPLGNVTASILSTQQGDRTLTMTEGQGFSGDSLTLPVSFAAPAAASSGQLCVLLGNGPIAAFDRNAVGEARPQRTISPGSAQPFAPAGLAVDDAASELYVASSSTVAVFARSGGPAPLRTQSYDFGAIAGPIALDPVTHELFIASPSQASVAVVDGTQAGLISATRSLDVSVLALAFDPVNGELWVGSSSNGSQLLLTVFARGSSTPARTIVGSGGPARALAIDAAHDEVFVSSFDGAVDVYARTGDGAASPLRSLATKDGSGVLGSGPLGVAIDSANGELWIGDGAGQIGAFARGATDDGSPLRVIAGPATLLAAPQNLAFDQGQLLVAEQANDALLAFARTASGNAVPLRALAEGSAGAVGLALDASTGNILAVSAAPAVTAFSSTASGAATPVATLAGSGLVAPAAALVDAGELFIADSGGNAVAVYDSAASGDPAPLRTLQGPLTTLSHPASVAVTASALYVANAGDDSIAVFPRGASGNTAPSARIAGAATGLHGLARIAASASELFAASTGNGLVAVFPLSANGNVAPARTLAGPAGLSGVSLDAANGELYAFAPGLVAVYPQSASGAAQPSRTLLAGSWVYSNSTNAASFVPAPVVDAIACGPLPDGARAPYKMTLPGAAFQNSRAYAVNGAGQVVGEVRSPQFSDQSALFDGGAVSTFGFPTALGINANGDIVGGTLLGYFSSGAYLYSNGTRTNLPNFGGGFASATGINDSGVVSGWSALPIVQRQSQNLHAFVWSAAGGIVDLGTLGGGSSKALAINAAGTVVGDSQLVTNGPTHAFSFSAGAMTDLGVLGGSTSSATAINASGLIAGWSSTAGSGTHAFLYDGAMHDLGTLGGSTSFAYGIDGSGDVVGSAYTAVIPDPRGGSDSQQHAFVSRNGQLFDLGAPPGAYMSSAQGIGDSGVIAGYSIDYDGRVSAVVWVPVQ